MRSTVRSTVSHLGAMLVLMGMVAGTPAAAQECGEVVCLSTDCPPPCPAAEPEPTPPAVQATPLPEPLPAAPRTTG